MEEVVDHSNDHFNRDRPACEEPEEQQKEKKEVIPVLKCSICNKPATVSESPFSNPDEPSYCGDCAKRVSDAQTLEK